MELSGRLDPVVFMLWGRKAQKYRPIVAAKQHLVLEASHPSGLSAYRGFYECKHFSQANQFLQDIGKTPIDWTRHD
jgi:uracil-DNA glycosylase